MLVRAESDPYVDRHARAELHLAERLHRELERLLRKQDGRHSGPIVVYLVAGPDEHPPPEAGTIVRSLHPDSVSEPLALPLTRLLVERWFGPGALAAEFFLDGIAGLALARAGLGATVAEADAWVQAETVAGRPVSIFSGPSPALTSFVAYLHARFGSEPIQRFLASYDPSRHDEAALNAYERPLGALEESWLGGLRRRSGKAAAYSSFLRHMAPLLRPYRTQQLEYVAYTLVAVAASLALPLASKYLVDVVIPSRSGRLLAEFVLAVLAVYVVNAVVNIRRSYVNNRINQHMLNSLSEKVFARLQRLGHDFYGRAKVGDLTARLSGDVSIVILAMYQVTGVGLDAALKALAAAIALLLLSPLLGVPVLAVLPLLLVTSLALRSRQERESLELQRLVGEKTNLVQENLTGHALVKAFGLESRASAAYRAMVEAILRAALRLSVLTAMTDTTSALALILAELVVLGFGGWLVIQGQLSIGTLLAFIGLLGALYQPVQLLVGLGQTVQRATSSMDRMAELLDEPVTVAEDAAAVVLPRLADSVTLEQASFGYGTGRAIVQDLDLEIRSGDQVAIVGPSGAGKSTVTSLLMRFWDPDQGRVLFDGVDIRRATLRSLRDQIGIVFQETFILDTTLRENIRVGRPAASDEEIAAAARGAQLDTFVEALPHGFDTVLGERGTRMSGGQRQRVAIARVILRNPALLILDEATSALDPHTEKEILETLAHVARGRTTISITHRLAIAASASLIYVMDSGMVVERGTHADLMALGGLYRRLYLEQSGRERTLETDAARLAGVGLFRELDPTVIENIAQRLRVHRFGDDEAVVRQGEMGDRMYLIMTGRLEVAVEDPQGPRRVAVLGEGDHFGEMALLTGEPRTATVRTLEASELLALSARDFDDLLSKEPTLRAAVDDRARQRQAALDSIGAGARRPSGEGPAAPP